MRACPFPTKISGGGSTTLPIFNFRFLVVILPQASTVYSHLAQREVTVVGVDEASGDAVADVVLHCHLEVGLLGLPCPAV